MRARFLAAAVLFVVPLLGACDALLDVDESGILTPEDLNEAGVASVTSMVYGVIGDYQEALDGIVRYASLMTDEMISAGSFGDRLEIDARFIQPNNPELTGAVYVPLHITRHLADTTALVLERRLNDDAYATAVPLLLQGIALSRLYAGYSRVWLAELYCWSVLTSVRPESAPLLPDARMRQALQVLRQAEVEAAFAGFQTVGLAAIVGQARAHLWLREFDLADAAAARVPRAFRYEAEYSQNSVQQYNEVYTGTWGDADPIGWTVGNGEAVSRGNERWEHFDQFVGLNLITVAPFGRTAENASIPVMLQMLYPRQDSEILMASGVEARLIRAEVAVRAGRTAQASEILSDLRADYSLRVALSSRVDIPDPENRLGPIVLTGDLAADLKTVADERARELWLTGDRFTTSRRFRADPLAIDLFPPVKRLASAGDDTAFPIAQRELDANPNLTAAMACPAGQTIGSWR